MPGTLATPVRSIACVLYTQMDVPVVGELDIVAERRPRRVRP